MAFMNFYHNILKLNSKQMGVLYTGFLICLLGVSLICLELMFLGSYLEMVNDLLFSLFYFV